MTIIDLFAGPGGWSEGLRSLGHSELGIEWDKDACATARAAGHERIRADVASAVVEHGGMSIEDHHSRMYHHWPAGEITGLIASPPCQAWSMAGKGGGREDVERCYQAAMALAEGRDEREALGAACEDARSMLVVEPLRWALALRPRWVACEQVPPVLEFWRALEPALRAAGYWTWAGLLSAEQYGVPQTRRRAFLLASLDGPVHPPQATHQAYRPGEPATGTEPSLLGPGLKPWVSMAQALGWDEGRVGFPRLADDGPATDDGYRERDFRDTGEPAFNVTEKARSWQMRANKQPNAAVRAVAEPAKRPSDTPAPTLRFGERMNDVSWVPPTHYDPRQIGAKPRPVEEPAPTMQSQGLAKGRDVFTSGRGDERYRTPAPTLVGTRRSKDGMLVGRQLPAGEGENVGGHGYDTDDGPKGSGSAVRVTIEQASVLQSFRPDYPWQGSRSACFQQIGNAVPPLLARAVLDAVLGVSVRREAA